VHASFNNPKRFSFTEVLVTPLKYVLDSSFVVQESPSFFLTKILKNVLMSLVTFCLYLSKFYLWFYVSYI
jgi:hypothetical protein